ncbi:MAG: MarC family protein [Bdellovibrionales bacterium]|nr:MarC family protein [Bdellovibrionales bacterium]
MFQNFLLTFTAVFVALDIIGTLPVYLGMTRDLPEDQRRKVVNQSMLVALVVAVVFMVGGRALFRYLGIQLFDFKMAGGLVLLLISLADLLGGQENKQKVSGSTGVVPLAVPLITGPAVLTALMIQVDATGYPITLAALIVNYVFAWIVLLRSAVIQRVIGKDGTVVISKIAALLLAAIAVSMIRSGVFEAITTGGLK